MSSSRARMAGFGLVALACSSPSASIQVTTNGDTTVFTADPAVTTIEVDAIDQTGANDGVLLQPTSPQSAASFDLGDPSSSLVASLQLTGKDAAGDAVVFGATPFVELGALDGSTVQLFVQRRHGFATMPGAMTDARTKPLLATVGEALYWVGGSIAGVTNPLNLGGYDLLYLDQFDTQCGTSANATSFALVTLTQQNSDGDYAYAALLDASGAALSYIGLPGCDDATFDGGIAANLPKGLDSWSEVEGGQTVMGDDGTAYVVGASKLDAPSSAILALHPDASVTALASTSRQGAATALAPGGGIFLYGGSAAEGAAEIVESSGEYALRGDYAPDATMGLAAVQFDSKTMLVAGGTNPPLKIDLTCGGGCAAVPFGKGLPMALQSSSLFALGGSAFLIVGDDATGATHAFRLDGGDDVPPEIPLQIPRQGARAIQTSTGAIVIVGGGSATPESYVD